MKSTAAIHINFAQRTIKSVLLVTPIWQLALGALGVVLLIVALILSGSITEKKQLLEETLQHDEKKLESARHQVIKPVVIPEGRALEINAAILQLNLPWSDVFDAIEEATPANIALISIEPDPKKQLLKGEAEAINSDDMIAYIERLKKVALFVHVDLIKHEVNLQDQFKPIRFEFEAQWRDRP
jgi:Tfp pilus assembly protein PilN